jgi:SET domain-containing protein
MLVIKVKVKPSNAHELGLFADEPLKTGQVVVEPSTLGLDIELNDDDFNKLSKHEQDFISHYGFLNKFTKKHHLTFDNTRFINHSKNGNITADKDTGRLYTKRDIEVGEELTQDYAEFEDIRHELED